jgi:uncharacterized Zn-binding protein involved in type VI secretion
MYCTRFLHEVEAIFASYLEPHMKDELGRETARLGDTTDHGGEVIEAAADLRHMGIGVALEGHLVRCPKCNGNFPLIATGKRAHRGKRVIFLGDRTGCGATVMRA